MDEPELLYANWWRCPPRLIHAHYTGILWSANWRKSTKAKSNKANLLPDQSTSLPFRPKGGK